MIGVKKSLVFGGLTGSKNGWDVDSTSSNKKECLKTAKKPIVFPPWGEGFGFRISLSGFGIVPEKCQLSVTLPKLNIALKKHRPFDPNKG